jgi:hypothetical protein
MEIRIYNREMDLQGIIENQTSLIWTRKYFEPGCVEFYAPITDDNLKLTKRGNLVWIKGYKEAAVIEDRKLEENDNKKEITVKGRFLSSYMDRRLIKGTVNFSGKVEVAMRQLLSGVTAIPRVVLGDLQGFDETVEFQATYKNLLEYEEKLSKGSALGFRFRPDFDAKVIYFEVYRGVDRTSSQGVNNRVVFSEAYNNLNDAVYRENDQLYKNVAFVGGEGEGSARTIVQVGSGSGLDLRELFVDAKDITADDLTAAQYNAALITRGNEKLAENIISTSFECDTGADVNFVYKQHYDLGDVVTVKKKEWGITVDQRITEIREIYEYGGRKLEPTFGDSLPESIDWSDT